MTVFTFVQSSCPPFISVPHSSFPKHFAPKAILAMALVSTQPLTLLTIPVEIRNIIWELLYIRRIEQDPDATTLRVQIPNDHYYPHMKGMLYCVNRQLLDEHKTCMTWKSCETDYLMTKTIGALWTDFPEIIQRRLTYPSIGKFKLILHAGK